MGASTLTDTTLVSCPKCGGRVWDNRATKKNPKAPDYKCQNRSCDGAIWPEKKGATPVTPIQPTPAPGVIDKPKMRDAYKSLTEWVLSDIAPIYESKDYGLTAEGVAACVQTLFIQACQSGKVE